MTPITLTLSSRIPFGQYKGRLVSDILKLDPKYLKWLWIEKKAITPDNILKQRLKENMKIKQLREAIKQIIRKELKENQPAPSKPERETTTIPAKPGTKEKPDEKRRKIGNPDVKPKPKNKINEDEIVNKITSRFNNLKKSLNEKSLNEMGGPVPKATINIEYVGAPNNINDEKIQRCTTEVKQKVEETLKNIFNVPINIVTVKFNEK